MATGIIEAIIGGNGAVIPVGSYADVQIPGDCSLYRWTALADEIGSISVDLRTCTQAQYDGGVSHPVSADSITGGNPIMIVSGIKGQDTVLGGWSRTLIAGNVLRFIVTAVSSIQQITVSLEILK
jgi:hypothetical protein